MGRTHEIFPCFFLCYNFLVFSLFSTIKSEGDVKPRFLSFVRGVLSNSSNCFVCGQKSRFMTEASALQVGQSNTSIFQRTRFLGFSCHFLIKTAQPKEDDANCDQNSRRIRKKRCEYGKRKESDLRQQSS